MRARAILILSCVLLCSCVTREETAARSAVAQGNREQQCVSFGYKQGTPDYSKCLESLYLQDQRLAARILFWNARLLTPSWLDNDLGAMRVTLESLKNERFLRAVGDVLRHRNHFGANGQANVTIRSVSASPEMLEEAAALLRSTKPWGGVSVETIAGMDAIVPSQQAISHSAEQGHVGTALFRQPEWTQFNWLAPIARPPTKLPEHLADAPPQQHFARGYWCADFSLEYEGTGARYGKNIWKLPSRWLLARAFEHSHAGADGPTGWSPPGWRSQSGAYSTYVSEVRPIATLEPPTVLSAIRWALAIDGTRPPRMGDIYPSNKVGRLEPSNEARYLKGILGMIGGLDSASTLLLHPFLINLFASFGGTTKLSPEKVIPIANRLKKKARSNPQFDLQNERERNALAAFIIKASGSIRKPMDYISYQDLSARWEEHRKAYWRENPQPSVSGDTEDWNSHERRSLDACLVEMRRRQMIFQGHQWTCSHCHHKNWLNLSELSSELFCSICKEPEDAPINLKWLFRPNPFLIQSLRDHSVLSVIWTLVTLRNRSRNSFLFVEPTWFYFDRDGDDPDAEADLLVILDGRAMVCEVKASWAIVRASDISGLVALAKRLRPDTALLAVMDNGMEMESALASAKAELMAVGINFDLLTLDRQPLDDSPYLN